MHAQQQSLTLFHTSNINDVIADVRMTRIKQRQTDIVLLFPHTIHILFSAAVQE